MKVLSTALLALVISAPAFASVTVSLPEKAVAVLVDENKQTGEATIAAVMPDDSRIKLADTTMDQINSDLPISKVDWKMIDQGSRSREVQVNPKFLEQQSSGGYIVNDEKVIVRHQVQVFPSNHTVLEDDGSVSRDNAQHFRKNERINNGFGPGYAYPAPGIPGGPAPYDPAFDGQ